MKIFKNPEFFKVGNSGNMTVTITMNLDNKVTPEVAMLNAAEALKFYYEYNQHKSWVTKIEVK